MTDEEFLYQCFCNFEEETRRKAKKRAKKKGGESVRGRVGKGGPRRGEERGAGKNRDKESENKIQQSVRLLSGGDQLL